MAHITKAQQGLDAVENRNWDEAVAKLSTALAESQNPAWLIARSKALHGLKRFPESLADAELAWHRAYDRNNRLLLADAHYRRAMAYLALGQFANADACCIYSLLIAKGQQALEDVDPAAKSLDESGNWTMTVADARAYAESGERAPGRNLARALVDSTPQAGQWRLASTVRVQILGKMEKLPEDDPGRKLTTGQKPPLNEIALFTASAEENGGPSAAAKPAGSGDTAPRVQEVQEVQRKPAVPKDTPLQLQDFQSTTTMTVSILSKGVDRDALRVQFLPTSVYLQPVVYPSGDLGDFRLDLWGEIDPEASEWFVSTNKIELRLAKKTPGKWPSLKPEPVGTYAVQAPSQTLPIRSTKGKERAVPATAISNQASSPDTGSSSKAPAIPAGQLAYPTSSRTGPKNWDLVGADEDAEDESDINFFFRKLYKGANPDQQRAMMKSFTESNGTTLSTDWDDVKGRTVETSPPKGVEAKKWK